ncbi:DNA primase [Novosphingobium chloroacetimidivorans]|uniref:DNA primase n=1 Tax=Novosphingobium chloroacetimidivorans TaxID=1428314 RepID=A0A7W7K9P1_9SPHN|nr:CHC2 zinc finger domain-containing protein [Novosphingobium chloroacetimidivorans]MBB4858279.1 DNA primase [Novosphingobium chloroacetimidivorans]
MAREARDRYDLSDVIGPYTKLEPRGASRSEKVGLCPFHNERTPSFEVNDDKGTYHCWGCKAGGDAIHFLMNIKGIRWREAVEWLLGAELPRVSPEERARRKAEDEQRRAGRIALARAIWNGAGPPGRTPAEVYARSRGITMPLPDTIRFAMTPRWYDPESGEAGRDYPAMVCALQDAAGAITAVQCVYLQHGGREKYRRIREGQAVPAKLTWGVLPGSALRLGPACDRITLCEGPEDGLTLAQEMPDRSVWVSCGTAMLHQIALPPEVTAVTLAGDNGEAGHKAVLRAMSAYRAHGLGVDSVFPAPSFKDWNDQLNGKGR